MPSLLKYQVLDRVTGAVRDSGSLSNGNKFNWNAGWQSDDVVVRIYADSDGSGAYTLGEPKVDTASFRTLPTKIYNLTYDISSITAAIWVVDGRTTLAAQREYVQEAIDQSVARATVKNSQGDYRAAFRVVVTPFGTGVFDATILPDPVDSTPKSVIHYIDMPNNHVRFVSEMDIAFGGVGNTFGDEILLEWNAADAFVHEFGHYLGLAILAHPLDQTLIMSTGWGDALTESEAQTYSE